MFAAADVWMKCGFDEAAGGGGGGGVGGWRGGQQQQQQQFVGGSRNGKEVFSRSSSQ